MGLGKTLSMLSLVLKKKGDSQDVRKWLAKPPAVEGRRGEREERELERQEDGGGGRGKREGEGKGWKRVGVTTHTHTHTHTHTGLLKCPGTLVVCPASLMMQWEAEVNGKIRPGLVRAKVYHGSNRTKFASE